MGLDCAIILRFDDELRLIPLDRWYVFSPAFDESDWMTIEECKAKIRGLLDWANLKPYNAFWLGYADACLDIMTGDNVGIFHEETPEYFQAWERQKNEPEFILVGEANGQPS